MVAGGDPYYRRSGNYELCDEPHGSSSEDGSGREREGENAPIILNGPPKVQGKWSLTPFQIGV
jgi:hypothetical protein